MEGDVVKTNGEDGLGVVFAWEGRLYKRNRAGDLLWSAETNGVHSLGSFESSRFGGVSLLLSGHTLVAHSEEDGRCCWQWDLPVNWTAAPASGNRLIVYGDHNTHCLNYEKLEKSLLD